MPVAGVTRVEIDAISGGVKKGYMKDATQEGACDTTIWSPDMSSLTVRALRLGIHLAMAISWEVLGLQEPVASLLLVFFIKKKKRRRRRRKEEEEDKRR